MGEHGNLEKESDDLQRWALAFVDRDAVRHFMGKWRPMRCNPNSTSCAGGKTMRGIHSELPFRVLVKIVAYTVYCKYALTTERLPFIWPTGHEGRSWSGPDPKGGGGGSTDP